jgi:D-tyrosyl-tRNA(Tyr) deacylase
VRVVLQRVSRAEVRVDGRVVGRVGTGLVLLVGFKAGDGRAQIDWMADKVLGLRVFRDEEDKMNRSLDEVGGDLLVVSQFTLYGDVAKGRRPSFVDAAPPDVARALYEDFVGVLRAKTSRTVETGEFGAMMEVDLVNDGPVTLTIDRDA